MSVVAVFVGSDARRIVFSHVQLFGNTAVQQCLYCARRINRLLSQSQCEISTATSAPNAWAIMKAPTLAGAIPANVSDKDRAMVTAGFANDVDDVNQ